MDYNNNLKKALKVEILNVHWLLMKGLFNLCENIKSAKQNCVSVGTFGHRKAI